VHVTSRGRPAVQFGQPKGMVSKAVWAGCTVVVFVAVVLTLASVYVLGRNLLLGVRSNSAATVAYSLPIADQPPGPLRPYSLDAGALGDQQALLPDEAGQGRQPQTSGKAGSSGLRSTTGNSSVALTFDDGPDPRYTPQVLALLREYHVTATFCVVGENARAHPDLIRAIVADGHSLCNHSWKHDMTLGARSPDRIRADLQRTNEAIHAATADVPISYYRQPGGAWTRTVVAVANDLGTTALHWAVDPSDWQAPGADRITARVLNNVRPGSVVLLHDAGGNRQGTIDALRRILPDLTSRFRVSALPSHTG